MIVTALAPNNVSGDIALGYSSRQALRLEHVGRRLDDMQRRRGPPMLGAHAADRAFQHAAAASIQVDVTAGWILGRINPISLAGCLRILRR
jgi:hypothetical protein